MEENLCQNLDLDNEHKTKIQIFEIFSKLMYLYGDVKRPCLKAVQQMIDTIFKLIKDFQFFVQKNNIGLKKTSIFQPKYKNSIGHLLNYVFYNIFQSYKQFKKLSNEINSQLQYDSQVERILEYDDEYKQKTLNKLDQNGIQNLNIEQTERLIMNTKRIDLMDQLQYDYFMNIRSTNFLTATNHIIKFIINYQNFQNLILKSEVNHFLEFISYLMSKICQKIIEKIIRYRNNGALLLIDSHLTENEIIQLGSPIISYYQSTIKKFFNKSLTLREKAYKIFESEFKSQQYENIFMKQTLNHVKICWRSLKKHQKYWENRIISEQEVERAIKTNNTNFSHEYGQYLFQYLQKDQYQHYIQKISKGNQDINVEENQLQIYQQPDFAQIFKEWYLIKRKEEFNQQLLQSDILQDQPKKKIQRLESLFD